MAERLTDRRIAALKPPAAGRSYIFDSECVGLGLLVLASGVKSFFLRWSEPNGAKRHKTIGQHPAWTIAAARIEASRQRRRVDSGESLLVKPERAIGDLLTEWQKVLPLTRRPSTARRYSDHVERFLRPEFGKDSPKALARNRIEAWHGRIAKDTPVQANRALATASAFLSWLARDGLIENNPARGVVRFPEDERQIFLDSTEMSVALAFLDRHPDRGAALSISLSLLTGARIGEAVAIRAFPPDLKRGLWIKPSAHTKAKKQHIAPLPAPAIPVASELLELEPPTERELRKVIEALRVALNRPEIRIHDLRHSRASALARHGASLPQIGRLLGQTAPQSTRRYVHLVAGDLVNLVERAAEEPAQPAPRQSRA